MRFAAPLRASALVDILGPGLLSEPLPIASYGLLLQSIDAPQKATPGSLVCLGKDLPRRHLAALNASLVLIEEANDFQLPTQLPVLKVASAYGALARLLTAFEGQFAREKPFAAGGGNAIHAAAVVEGVLEGEVRVDAHASIGEGAFIGRGTRIEAGARILPHVRIGRNCVIQSGAVVGCQGFGFYEDGSRVLRSMPHPAGAHLGDEVFVGAQTVIAAGVLHPTLIGEGSKIDSHVQIGHNVELGAGALMASQSGIAGSTVIGQGLRMGGAASIAGHLRLGEYVSVAACSAVTKDIPSHAVVAGFPAKPIREWRKQEALWRRLSEGKIPRRSGDKPGD